MTLVEPFPFPNPILFIDESKVGNTICYCPSVAIFICLSGLRVLSWLLSCHSQCFVELQ